MAKRFPVLFIPHGGGPLPLLGDASHKSMVEYLKQAQKDLPSKPKAILVVSAHWEEKQVTVQTTAKPSMIFDYYNFPPESYKYSYASDGAPDLARKAKQFLAEAGFAASEDSERGYDHGVFVPLLLMFPDASIPVFQLSLQQNLNAGEHVKMGKALQSLRDEGVLILGSGMSYHNLGVLLRGEGDAMTPSDKFSDWLIDSCSKPEEERSKALAAWTDAPYARECHPREEHLIPLMVCAGAAGSDDAKVTYDDVMMKSRVIGVQFG